jgi:hypothetical protein
LRIAIDQLGGRSTIASERAQRSVGFSAHADPTVVGF